MGGIDLKRLEVRLLEERRRTLDELRQAETEEESGQRASAGDDSRLPSHPADIGSDTQEIEKDFANIARESSQLTLIDDALRRLREEPNRYARCETCGAPIEETRFELIPWARQCSACAREAEERGS